MSIFAQTLLRDFPMSNSSPLSDFTHLTVSERILIVEQIWDSISAEQTSLPLTPTQRAELDVRLEALHQSPQEGASWEEVKARIQA